jgi:pilus assembly protein Flp/PilA
MARKMLYPERPSRGWETQHLEKTLMISLTLMQLQTMFQDLMNREEGQDLVEYALLVTLIALVCVAALSALGGAVSGVFAAISADL